MRGGKTGARNPREEESGTRERCGGKRIGLKRVIESVESRVVGLE